METLSFAYPIRACRVRQNCSVLIEIVIFLGCTKQNAFGTRLKPAMHRNADMSQRRQPVSI